MSLGSELPTTSVRVSDTGLHFIKSQSDNDSEIRISEITIWLQTSSGSAHSFFSSL